MICRRLFRISNNKNTPAMRAIHGSGLRCSAAAIRGIPSSVIDIYKVVEYTCPETLASAEESREVAGAVNGADTTASLTALGMSKTMATKILKHRERQQRDFERVEQFLDLDQMTISKLEREVAKMIMRLKKDKMALGDDERGWEGDIAKMSKAKLSKKLLKMISPSVNSESWKNVETVIGIKLTLDSLSYAKITKEMELLEWDVIKIFGRAYDSRKNNEFPQPLNAGIATTAAIPTADAYFLEAPVPIQGQKDIMMQLKNQTMRMQSTIAALLSLRFGQHSQEQLIYEVRYGLREALLGPDTMEGGGQTGLRHRAEKWLLDEEPMSPLYRSMRMRQSEQGLVELMSDYALEKDKKEQLMIALVTAASAVHTISEANRSVTGV